MNIYSQVIISVQEENIAVEEEMVENLIAKGFGDHLPDSRRSRGHEVTVAIVR